MKKLILVLIMTIMPQLFFSAFAQQTRVINLHSDGAYILNMDNRPMELDISNKNVVNAEVLTELYTPDSQLVVRTFQEGISYITFKLKNKPNTIKVLVDNRSPVDKEVIEIDRVKEP